MAVDEERSCTGKRRYSDRKRAKSARGRTRQHDSSKGRLNVYRCDFCGFFHLGHLPPEVRNGEVDKREWRTG